MKNEFKLSNIKQDLSSGLVVFLVALPLSLGIALASGAPLFSGIIAGIVGGIVVGLISGSNLGVSGPAAGLTVIVLNAIEVLNSYESLLVAIVLAGLFQIIFGVLRLGIVGYYFPSSVIKGMMAAIGIILILKQIPFAFGFSQSDSTLLYTFENDFLMSLGVLAQSFINIHWGAFLISVVSMFILIIYDKALPQKFSLLRFLPSALIVVLVGIFINLIFEYSHSNWALTENQMVMLPVANSLKSFFGFFTYPDWDSLYNPYIYKVAFTIAVIASIETLLCAEATDKLDPLKRNTPANKELIAQGVGNFFSGLIGGLPITQVIVRSSANIDAGGKTKIATIFHGFLILFSVLLIPKFLNQIPLASLASVLILVGYKLSKAPLYKAMYKLGWNQFIPFLVTIFAILITDLLVGIGIGIAFSIFYILRTNYRIPYFFDENNTSNYIKIFLAQEVSFLNKAGIQLMLEKLPSNTKVEVDGSKSVYIDYDVLEILQEFEKVKSISKNIDFHLVNVKSKY